MAASPKERVSAADALKNSWIAEIEQPEEADRTPAASSVFHGFGGSVNDEVKQTDVPAEPEQKSTPTTNLDSDRTLNAEPSYQQQIL